jgi:D-arabinose 1-dehydrogenase-like Zn-dependent alcohol dehydrogenase
MVRQQDEKNSEGEVICGGIMPKMRAVQVTRPKGPFEIIEREIPEPGGGDVRVKVEACSICHSGSFTKEGTSPSIQYPRVPGHEIAGIVDAVGSGVSGWEEGQRVGLPAALSIRRIPFLSAGSPVCGL